MECNYSSASNHFELEEEGTSRFVIPTPKSIENNTYFFNGGQENYDEYRRELSGVTCSTSWPPLQLMYPDPAVMSHSSPANSPILMMTRAPTDMRMLGLGNATGRCIDMPSIYDVKFQQHVHMANNGMLGSGYYPHPPSPYGMMIPEDINTVYHREGNITLQRTAYNPPIQSGTVHVSSSCSNNVHAAITPPRLVPNPPNKVVRPTVPVDGYIYQVCKLSNL
jgi:hypothetical protein